MEGIFSAILKDTDTIKYISGDHRGCSAIDGESSEHHNHLRVFCAMNFDLSSILASLPRSRPHEESTVPSAARGLSIAKTANADSIGLRPASAATFSAMVKSQYLLITPTHRPFYQMFHVGETGHSFPLPLVLWLTLSTRSRCHPLPRSMSLLTYPRFSLTRPCARDFVQEMCHQSRRRFTTNWIAAHVITGGNYGNHYIQLQTVLTFAVLTGIQKVFVDNGFCWLTTGMSFQTLHGIRIAVVTNSRAIPYPRSRWIDAIWFFTPAWCPDFTWRYFADSLRRWLLPVLPVVDSDPELPYLFLGEGKEIWNLRVSQTGGVPDF
jgi:hypothetical protein